MNEKEFQLLEEPWIRVSTHSLEQKEVSLLEAMLHAQEYAGLSGEMPTQDAAVLRVLLAIGQTIFYHYDENGQQEELSKENDVEEQEVLERWKGYWDAGGFPRQAVKEYLETYRERFWLFHPETPFWQVPNLQYGTEYGSECLVGNVKESNNKATRHHFSLVEGENLTRLSYGEAARWLIHLNGYGVNVKADKKAPGTTEAVGTGRLGQLGLVIADGRNLFEILMLNLCPLREDGELWELPKPVWEKELHTEQGRRIPPPGNLPERYTMQSRRIALKRDGQGYVTGFRAIGGEFCSVENDFDEPMTLWRQRKADKKTEQVICVPRPHDPAVHAWQEFPALLRGGNLAQSSDRIPGIVQWTSVLYQKKLLDKKDLVTFKMVGLTYGDQMKYTYGDCVNDTLSLSAGLLTELGEIWILRISDEVEKCQKVANEALSHFASRISRLFYGSDGAKNHIRDGLVRQYYFQVDQRFRSWLAGIDPAKNEREEKLLEWETESYDYARQTVETYLTAQNLNLCARREEEKEIITVPKAIQAYLWELNRIYPQKAGNSGKEEA